MRTEDFILGLDGVEINNYPFTSASVYPNAFIPYIDIVEITYWYTDGSIKLKNGEYIFFPRRTSKSILQEFHAKQYDIKTRSDPWCNILEPYLDTETDENDLERCYDQLQQVGISRQECDEIRGRVGDTVLAYNALLWEPWALGLFDILSAYELLSKKINHFDSETNNFINYTKEVSTLNIDKKDIKDIYALGMLVANKALLIQNP